MLPEKIKSDALAIRINKKIEYRTALINCEPVKEKLSDVELMIANSSLNLPMSAIPEKELLNNIVTAAKFICRDVGIKDWSNAEIMKYDAVRFFTTLRTYYKDLTIKEVKIAFELAVVGELDEWLPKDRNGQPDKNHYQNFSVEYYTKILKAYRAKKNKVWFKATKALPAPEFIITEEEKASNRKHFLQDIYNAFELYKKDGTRPSFTLSIFIKEFINQGLIKELPELSEKSKLTAYNKLILAKLPKHEKTRLTADYYKNNDNSLLMTNAQFYEYNRAITFIFIRLIRRKIDIKTVIK